jgi:hypothetical protein
VAGRGRRDPRIRISASISWTMSTRLANQGTKKGDTYACPFPNRARASIPSQNRGAHEILGIPASASSRGGPPLDPRMAEGDAAVATASPRSPAPPETPATQRRRQRGLVSRVWKGIFGGREDVEKLLQSLSKEEEAVRARLRRRARASRQSSHNVLALAAALEVTRSRPPASFRFEFSTR